MRKEKKAYYFSVEGETEKWYLDWLQDTINAHSTARYTVKLDSKIQKDPLSRAKGLTIIGKTEVIHISIERVRMLFMCSNSKQPWIE